MLGCCVSLLPRLFLLPDVVTLASFAVFGSLSGLSLVLPPSPFCFILFILKLTILLFNRAIYFSKKQITKKVGWWWGLWCWPPMLFFFFIFILSLFLAPLMRHRRQSKIESKISFIKNKYFLAILCCIYLC